MVSGATGPSLLILKMRFARLSAVSDVSLLGFLFVCFFYLSDKKSGDLQSGVQVNLSQVFCDGVICRGFDSLMDPGMVELAGINAQI